MNVLKFVKEKFNCFSRLEIIFFPLIISFIIGVSILKHDNLIALISALCGITYTVLAGKGKVFCYFFGITATLCYSYLAYTNALWGNFALNMFYYLPLSIIGVFLWKKHLKKDKQEIEKAYLSLKARWIYLSISVFATFGLMLIFEKFGDNLSFFDAFTTVFSVLGMLLTVKRCIEQWVVWFLVNIFSAFMWWLLYLNGGGYLSVVIKWLIYAILAVYFLIKWQKELTKNIS